MELPFRWFCICYHILHNLIPSLDALHLYDVVDVGTIYLLRYTCDKRGDYSVSMARDLNYFIISIFLYAVHFCLISVSWSLCVGVRPCACVCTQDHLHLAITIQSSSCVDMPTRSPLKLASLHPKHGGA